MGSRVQEYWDKRGKEEGAAHTATTNDVYLRELEIRTCVSVLQGASLQAGSRVLDIGCGDGHSTIAVARVFPQLWFVGVDYASGMIDAARLGATGQPAIEFRVGDATNLDPSLTTGEFAAAISMRCLINLESQSERIAAFRHIAAALTPGGRLIAFENFIEGQEELNRARARMDLPPIPIRWHNRYFTQEEFRALAAPFFDDIAFEDFASGYYYATRVLYSAMCVEKKEQPDYCHDIHRLAVKLPPTGRFSPVRLVVATRKE